MNTTAIERIKGFCCEVTQRQWDELVRVADEVGCDVFPDSRKYGMVKPDRYVGLNSITNGLCIYADNFSTVKLIPYPDFLAKLKGEEKWGPKNGEMVEVEFDGKWYEREYIGVRYGRHFVWSPIKAQTWVEPCGDSRIRPIRPTITRAEAEQKLNCRITD